MIDNFRAPNFRVWNDNVLVIECDHICRKQCNRVHFPECTTRFDEIAHFIRTVQDQHDTCRKAGQSALQRQTNGQTGSTQDRDNR